MTCLLCVNFYCTHHVIKPARAHLADITNECLGWWALSYLSLSVDASLLEPDEARSKNRFCSCQLKVPGHMYICTIWAEFLNYCHSFMVQAILWQNSCSACKSQPFLPHSIICTNPFTYVSLQNELIRIQWGKLEDVPWELTRAAGCASYCYLHTNITRPRKNNGC